MTKKDEDTKTEEKLPTIQEAIRNHEKARAAFNAQGEGWKPETDKGVKVRADLRKARRDLVAITGADNVRDAYKKAEITPKYRSRAKAEAKAS